MSSPPAAPSRALHLALWGVQILLAVVFAMAGAFKTFTPIADLAAQLVWPGEVPAAVVRFVGVSELAGAAGMILPSALRILPKLTAAAGAGLVLAMIVAVGVHAAEGAGAGRIGVPLVTGALAAFVTVGRARWAPILPR